MKLLNPFDQVGLIAFNADWEWTVPIGEAGKREQIAGRLAALTHSGGTDLYKGLQEGLRALKEVRAVKTPHCSLAASRRIWILRR